MSSVPGRPGVLELSIPIGALPPPDPEFYCQTLAVQLQQNYGRFLFGQFGAQSAFVRNSITIDMPYAAIRATCGTFDPDFRERMETATRGLGPVEEFAMGRHELQSVSYLGHLVKLIVNEFAGVLDFYELVPVANGRPHPAPVIRIKTHPSVARHFVEQCDEIVRKLPSQQPELGLPETLSETPQ